MKIKYIVMFLLVLSVIIIPASAGNLTKRFMDVDKAFDDLPADVQKDAEWSMRTIFLIVVVIVVACILFVLAKTSYGSVRHNVEQRGQNMLAFVEIIAAVILAVIALAIVAWKLGA